MKTLFLVVTVILLAFLLADKIRKSEKQKKKIAELTKWHAIALTDDLTKIPNRAAYSREIEKNNRNADMAVILFDIDDFKNINDSHGHLEGDRVLQDCARLLCQVFAKPDFKVYRIGGDEFAVIAYNVGECLIIEKFLEIRSREENGLGFRLSKGYCLSDGKRDFDSMFSHADEMLYADKLNKN